MCGRILDKYNELGGTNSRIGLPTSDELGNPDGRGRRTSFDNDATIYWTAATDAHVIGGAIGAKWCQRGCENWIGYPTSDELTNPDGAGKRNSFERDSSIYWSSETGANQIGGQVGARWGQLGYEGGTLGYPRTDENATPDGVGRYNHFQRGSIYWTANTGAWNMPTNIYTVWATKNYEKGPLGYPTGAPSNTVSPAISAQQQSATAAAVAGNPAVVMQRFQNGTASATNNSVGYYSYFNTNRPAASVPPNDSSTTPTSIWDVLRVGTDKCNRTGPLRRGYYNSSTDRGFGADKIQYKHGITNFPLFNEMLKQPDCGYVLNGSQTNVQYDMPIGILTGCLFSSFFCSGEATTSLHMGVDYRANTAAPVAPKTFGLVTMFCVGTTVCPSWVNDVKVG